MKEAAAVPYQKSFLLMGGRRETTFSHHLLDGVFWYNGARDVWQRSRTDTTYEKDFRNIILVTQK